MAAPPPVPGEEGGGRRLLGGGGSRLWGGRMATMEHSQKAIDRKMKKFIKWICPSSIGPCSFRVV